MALAEGSQTALPPLRWSTRQPFVLAQRAASKKEAGQPVRPPTRGTRTVEAPPAAPPKAVTNEELSSALVRDAHSRIDQALPAWPVSLVPHVSHVSRQRNYAHSEGQSGHPAK